MKLVSFTSEQLRQMSPEQIEGEIEKRIYQAALFFEELEWAGLLGCNGHHVAQKITAEAIAYYKTNKR